MSYKIKRLLVIAIAIVILAMAANAGTRYNPPVPKDPVILYPYVPADINPAIIDPNIGNSSSLPAKKTLTPIKPVVTTVPKLISAEAYLVKNLDTDQVYSSYNNKRVFPIASLSKLVTAVIAMENILADAKITITQEMLDSGYGEAGNLKVGEVFTVSELLYPLLLESSNDAAEALAKHYGYAEFINKMNVFVAGLGMSATTFRDASGLSSGNVSNADNLFILAQYLYIKDKPLLELTKTKTMTLASTTEHSMHIFNTINPFPFDPNFMGGKTGRTNEAKESMISLFRYEHAGASYPVAVIVLLSDFKIMEVDSNALFEQFLK
ncbi:MAG: serine hydrolase, partial [Patescibacteria group bacterium]